MGVGQWVFGGICRESRTCFMVPVEKRDSTTLLEIIQEKIEPGSTIISDCWKSCNCLQEEGYQHLTVNHSLHFVDPTAKAHTNCGVISRAKCHYTEDEKNILWAISQDQCS